MPNRRKLTRSRFPTYLPSPNKTHVAWVAHFLKERRKENTPKPPAREDSTELQEIEALENGIWHLGVGRFRYLLKKHYQMQLEDVLAECFNAFKADIDPQSIHAFQRDQAYSVFYKNSPEGKMTPSFVGGNPSKFIWAVPFRRLKNQQTFDFLELAPKRKSKPSGETVYNVHDGYELLHVINGTVSVVIRSNDVEKSFTWTVDAGASVHFNSMQQHRIENASVITSALVMVARQTEVKIPSV